MPLTDTDIEELVPILYAIAGNIGRTFPPWWMSKADLVQVAFLSILQVLPCEGETTDDLRRRRLKAGQNRMIGAMRFFHDLREGRSRRLETLVPMFDDLARDTLVEEDFEDNVIEMIDWRQRMKRLPTLIQQLPTREQFIVQERFRGELLADIGKQLNLTEGRMCQIEKHIVARLREAYRETVAPETAPPPKTGRRNNHALPYNHCCP